DVFDTLGDVRRPRVRNAAADGDSSADALLAIFGIVALEEVAAQAQAVSRIEQVRLAPRDRVALQGCAGYGFDAELLPSAAPGPAFENIVPSARPPGDVEVPLVDDDAAGKARIRGDAGADHEAAGRLFLDGHQNILEWFIDFRPLDLDARLDALHRI